MSYAIDRSKVSSIGESGYEPPANQAGIVSPTFSSWLDPSAAGKYSNGYNPAKAKQMLASAGFKTGSDGIMANSKGQKLSFSVINIGDYSDWVASMQVVAQNLKAVSIQLTPDNLTNTDFTAALYTGKYQLAFYDQQTFGPSPYYELRNWLDSAGTAADRQDGGHQLRAVQQPGHGQPVQPVRGLHQHGAAAHDHEPDPAGDAGRAAYHPGGSGGGLVPVQRHVADGLADAEQPLRPARLPMRIRTWSRCCSTCGRSDRGACPGAGARARTTPSSLTGR